MSGLRLGPVDDNPTHIPTSPPRPPLPPDPPWAAAPPTSGAIDHHFPPPSPRRWRRPTRKAGSLNAIRGRSGSGSDQRDSTYPHFE